MSGPGDPAENNTVFERLVPQEADPKDKVLGMIAYARYKQAKREWIIQFCDRNKRPPDAAEMHAYVQSWTPGRLEGLKSEARGAFREFAGQIVDDNKAAIQQDALRNRFWAEVISAFFGALAYTLFLLLGGILAERAGIDLLHVYQQATGAEHSAP